MPASHRLSYQNNKDFGLPAQDTSNELNYFKTVPLFHSELNCQLGHSRGLQCSCHRGPSQRMYGLEESVRWKNPRTFLACEMHRLVILSWNACGSCGKSMITSMTRPTHAESLTHTQWCSLLLGWEPEPLTWRILITAQTRLSSSN